MTALNKELSNAEFKSNKPNNTILVSLPAAVEKKIEKYHEVICYSSFKWFLCIHVTKVEMEKDNKSDKTRCCCEQLHTFKERMSYIDKAKGIFLASNWITNSLTASIFSFFCILSAE